MAHCETLPNGVVVRVTAPLTAEERAALTDYFDAIQAAASEHLAAMPEEERAALDAKRAAGAARLRKLREQAARG